MTCTRLTTALLANLLTTALLIAALADTAPAAIPAYLWIEGPNGPIPGSTNVASREGSIEAQALEHLLSADLDPASCALLAPHHRPFVFTKAIDRASPLLLQAFDNNESLNITCRFYKIDDTGREINFYTITFKDARITGFGQFILHSKLTQYERILPSERVAFTYGAMTHSFTDGTVIEYDAKWQGDCAPNDVIADLNFDGHVNLLDFAILNDQWLLQY